MSAIELVLANPESLDEEVSLFFELRDTGIARKYKDLLGQTEGIAILEPHRFYNFPHSRLDRHALAERINHCVDALNAYAPGIISVRADPHMDQDHLNRLHHYFEILRGPVLSPSEFIARAPLKVKLAIEHLNLTIHHFEALERNEKVLLAGLPPEAFVVVTFDKWDRHPLSAEDYEHFTRRRKFGSWSINYCEAGKPLWDVFQDRDEVIGDANVRPLRYYSRDAAVEFGSTMTETEYETMMAGFSGWWSQNEETLKRLGFERGDPKNAIGSIAVGDLVRDRGDVAGRSEEAIRELVGCHQYVSRVVYRDDSGPNEAKRILEKRIPDRLEHRTA